MNLIRAVHALLTRAQVQIDSLGAKFQTCVQGELLRALAEWSKEIAALGQVAGGAARGAVWHQGHDDHLSGILALYNRTLAKADKDIIAKPLNAVKTRRGDFCSCQDHVRRELPRHRHGRVGPWRGSGAGPGCAGPSGVRPLPGLRICFAKP